MTLKSFTILTEETPNIEEIKLMCAAVGVNIDSTTNSDIIPKISYSIRRRQDKKQIRRKFRGVWIIETKSIIITIRLFKGTTSSVDYLLFKGDVDLTTGNAGEALVILESTKTSDNASRNTAVYQRIVKFSTFDNMYPNFKGKKIMFWNSVWNNNLTATAIVGLRLMATIDIQLYASNAGKFIDLVEKYGIKKYKSCNEIISSKNKINKKKGNTSIRLSREENNISIGLKLDKGNGANAGKISHDPNVGFLAGLINAIEKVTDTPNLNKYIIKNHNIKQKYFDKCPRSKLWYSINDINIVFEECVIKKRPVLPSQYFTIESENTEKIATILHDQVEKNNTIFSNHGGCALTNIEGPNSTLSVGRKMPRPDIVFRNDRLKEIWIIEGKIEKDLNKGIKQLSDVHLNGFMGLLNKLYPDYDIKKGLCITISNIDYIDQYNNLEFPIKFALDRKGFFIKR
tara:strand:- start:2652 stop:4022 length:1371 start_codon:yes stop_codon:yes gene_type:complete